MAALLRLPAGSFAAAAPPAVDAGDPVPPWVRLAGFLLLASCPTLHPAQTMLAATLASAADVQQGILGVPGVVQRSALPTGLLTRMAAALQAVGPPVLREGRPVAGRGPVAERAALRRLLRASGPVLGNTSRLHTAKSWH